MKYKDWDNRFCKNKARVPTGSEIWDASKAEAFALLRREVEADINRRGGVLFTGADIFALIDKLAGGGE